MNWNTAVFGVALAALALGAGCRTASTAPPDGAAAFNDYCTPCHGDAGHGKANIAAPAIAGLPAWYVETQVQHFRTGVRGAHFDDIAGLRMRPMSRTLANDAYVTAVAQHISTLAPLDPEPSVSGGDAEAGKGHYATCLACHGAEGVGMEAVGSPPLVHVQDWYLLTQLGNFRSGIRGAHPDDKWGATMAPMAKTLPDEQAMKDVVAYIGTLSK